MVASAPGTDFDGKPVEAAGRNFYLGGSPATYCPQSVVAFCPPGNVTAFSGGSLVSSIIPLLPPMRILCTCSPPRTASYAVARLLYLYPLLIIIIVRLSKYQVANSYTSIRLAMLVLHRLIRSVTPLARSLEDSISRGVRPHHSQAILFSLVRRFCTGAGKLTRSLRKLQVSAQTARNSLSWPRTTRDLALGNIFRGSMRCCVPVATITL